MNGIITDDFTEWLKQEALKERQSACKKCRGNCSICPFEEDCANEELINSLEEW